MKIETRDMAPDPGPEIEPEPERASTRGLYVRAGIAIVLACVSVGALRWVVNTSNDNARQVSSTLTTLQSRIERPAPDFGLPSETRFGKLKAHRSRISGPALEPADRR